MELTDDVEGEEGVQSTSLSDFQAVLVVEALAAAMEERLDPSDFPAGTEGLMRIVSSASFAEQPFDQGLSPAIARLIIRAAENDPRWRDLLESVLGNLQDDRLHAGTALKAATLAIVLLAMSPSSSGDQQAPNVSTRVERADVPKIKLRNVGHDLKSLLEFLTDTLNSKYLTAFLNAVAFGTTVVGFKLIRRAEKIFLQDPEGNETPVPPEHAANLSELIAQPPNNATPGAHLAKDGQTNG